MTSRKIHVTRAGWKFTVVNGDRYLIRVGISDLAEASKLALQQVRSGRIKKGVQLSVFEVEQLNISNRATLTKVNSGNGIRRVSHAG